MRQFLLAILLGLVAGAAAAYPADMTVESGGLEVDAQLHVDGLLAIVRVSNRDTTAIRCDAEFFNGPERGRARHAIIPAGETAALRWSPRRTVVRLRVEVRCGPHS